MSTPAVDRLYLDAGGRAPVNAVAREAYAAAWAEGWADPRRLHTEGRRARLLLDGARESVAASLGARTEEVVFAPSFTTAVHHAVLGVAEGRRRAGRRIVASAVERAAVLQAARRVVGRHSDGRLHLVPVDQAGRVAADAAVEALSSPGCALAAVQHANGEVGTLQPVEEIHPAARRAGVPLLVDAGASLGHVEVPGTWDLLVADPGDWGGPDGVGVLAVRPRVRWAQEWPEDEAEGGWFPGGVAVPAALAAAASLAAVLSDRRDTDARRRRAVERLRARVSAEVPDVRVVGDAVDRLPHVVTFSCLYVDGEALVGELDRLGFAVGSGSACTSSTLEPSHVLGAMGALTHGNVRVVLPAASGTEDVDRFCDALPGAVARVRASLGVDGL